MRWLMIALLVSLGALLLAVAGMARHIWHHHRELQKQVHAETETVLEAGKKTSLKS